MLLDISSIPNVPAANFGARSMNVSAAWLLLFPAMKIFGSRVKSGLNP